MYHPWNWYWVDEAGVVFSSAARDVVREGDAAYEAWLAAGNRPTPWPRDESGAQTAAALVEVLAPYGIASA